jgi:mRNA-degrading endonuclease RelE of RelBE toxin-antitoxin system
MSWTVDLTSKVRRQAERLPEPIRAAFWALTKDMEVNGPYRTNWGHFGKLQGSKSIYHCHIASGRPTYVACWEVKDKVVRLIEVNYVGTHESAPY